MAKTVTKKKKRIEAKGFTLIEILAALLLIGLVLPAVMKGISIVSILASDSEHRYEAVDLAENKLAEVLLEGSWQDNSSQSDQFENEYEDYQWVLDVSDWTGASVKQVDIFVYWQQRNRQREIRLSTLVYNAD
ncbi:MAG: type II secretion system protein GspI [Planctomycetes bacterium]|nr:type II secretion system protein GspI [Planctomycetota bacterium]